MPIHRRMPTRSRPAVTFFAIVLTLYLAGSAAALTVTVEWIRQFGGPLIDVPRALAVDAAGNVYVAGDSDGLPGEPDAGGVEVWVRKYGPAGDLIWSRQFGTPLNEFIGFNSGGLAVGPEGVYVGGYTFGAFAGFSNAGGLDAFLRKYTHDGDLVWTRQFGTSEIEDIHDVAVDGDKAVYVVGSRAGPSVMGGQDAFIRKYTTDGAEVWTRWLATSANEHYNAIAFDSTGVYAAGHAIGALPGQTSAGGADAVVQRYTRDGELEWTRQFGTGAFDLANSVAADDGGVFIAGVTDGALLGQTHAGGRDAFVVKLNPGGQLKWARQFGTAGADTAFGVSVEGRSLFVNGTVSGALPGQAYSGGLRDAYVRKYDAQFGDVEWTHQFGTPGNDQAGDTLTTSRRGAVYVTGITTGSLGGAVAGAFDAFLMKLVTIE